MKLTFLDETRRVKKIRVKCHSDNSHSQDCQFEGMTFRILRMSDISISGFHYFEVSTFEWIDVKPKERLGNTACKSYTRCRSNAMSNKLENYQFSVSFDSTIRTSRALETYSTIPLLGNESPTSRVFVNLSYKISQLITIYVPFIICKNNFKKNRN